MKKQNKSGFSDWIIGKVGAWLQKEKGPKRAYLSDYDKIRHKAQLGDVLLVEGRNRVSGIIKRLTQSPWSHAMLYIGRLRDIEDPAMRARAAEFVSENANDDNRLVIESQLGQGTIITPLRHYENEHLRICRPISLTYEDAQKVINHAISRLGSEYSVRHILDLMRFLFPWSILPRRWRSSLFTHNALKPTEEICSSMIADAFQSINFPILPEVEFSDDKGYELTRRNPKLFTPSDFDYSPYFEIIKYPVFGTKEGLQYRHLPWKDESEE